MRRGERTRTMHLALAVTLAAWYGEKMPRSTDENWRSGPPRTADTPTLSSIWSSRFNKVMTQAPDPQPAPEKRVAISYSWKVPAHRKWVEELAKHLINTNIDVVLDIWELDFGDDSIQWMERFVNDKTIDRVLLICDKSYAESANARKGGVGIETQIISPSAYKTTSHSRFIPVVIEVDEEGNAALPTFMGSRWYVDMTLSTRYEEKFDELVKSIKGERMHEKPKFGMEPRRLKQDASSETVTKHKARTVTTAVINERQAVAGMLEDYFDELQVILANNQLRPLPIETHPNEIVDIVRNKAVELTLYKSEFVEVISTLARYGAASHANVQDAIHRFFSALAPYMHVQKLAEPHYDVGRYIVYEFFTSCIAALLRGQQFETATYILEQEYIDPDLAQHHYQGPEYKGTSNFNIFDPYLRSFELAGSMGHVSDRYSVGRLLLERSKPDEKLVNADDLVNADAVLYARGLSTALPRYRWSPKTIRSWNIQTAPVFRRARAKSFFNRLKPLLNVSDASNFVDSVRQAAERGKTSQLSHYPADDFNLHNTLFGLEYLATE